jgi:hypothetical protein
MTSTYRRRRRMVGVLSGVLLVSCFGVSGCTAVKAVKAANHVRHDVEGNKATVDSFTSTMKSSAATPFEATYVTSGKKPATVVYAAQPPTNLAFTETQSGSHDGATNINIVVNGSGEYSCIPASTGSGGVPSCEKLGKADAASQNAILDFYTPAHWVTFLHGFSLAAGFAGDTVTSSTKTVNGFALQCVNFQAAGEQGRSTICTTAQGILGYVKVAGDSTSFQIKAYTASPPASLFELPAGAKVTTLPTAAPTTS